LVVDLAHANGLASKDGAEVYLASAEADVAAARRPDSSVALSVFTLFLRRVGAYSLSSLAHRPNTPEH